MKEKIQFIEEKCIEANPDIAGICSSHDYSHKDCFACQCNIRKIHLADILNAVRNHGRKQVPWLVDELGFFWAKDITNSVMLLSWDVNWDLYKDYLELQSEATINFIFNYLQ